MDFIPALSSYVALFLAGANVAVFCIVKFNDLKHQEETLKRMETKLDGIDRKVDGTAERISKIEGKCLATHGN